MEPMITKAEARRFLLKKHGLLGKSPFVGRKGILTYVKQVGCVQYDPVDACGKSHELSFLSRVTGFTREMLWDLLYKDRLLMDFWDKNMSILLTEDWPYLEHVREQYRNQSRSREAVDAVAADIRSYLHTHGHASSRELALEGQADWYWSQTSLSRAALETLYFRGDLIIHHKQRTVKSYALAEDYLPAELLSAENPFHTPLDRQTFQVLRRIGAVGLLWNKASDAWLGIDDLKGAAREAAFARLLEQGDITPIRIAEIEQPLYLKTQDLPLFKASQAASSVQKEVRFIAPLDCLLWDRKLIRALFDFAYTWEIYTPLEKRVYSYYVLPVLYGETFVGRVEPSCDRKGKTLLMKRFWAEKGFRPTQAFRRAMEREAEKLCRFHGLERIDWSDLFWK